MTSDVHLYVFNLHRIEHSIIVNHFRQYFEILAGITINFAQIYLMVEFGHFILLI